MQKMTLKDLKKATSVHEGHFSGYKNSDGSPELNIYGAPRVSIYEAPSEVVIRVDGVKSCTLFPEFVGRQIAKVYMNNVDYKKELIDQAFQTLYGRALRFNEGRTFEMYESVQEIKSVCGDISNIPREFRSYLGYPCSFYRTKDGRRVPVETDRIISAYKAMKSKSSTRLVEKILYS